MAQLGHFKKALTAFETALSIDSSFSPAAEKIGLLEKLSTEGKISLE